MHIMECNRRTVWHKSLIFSAYVEHVSLKCWALELKGWSSLGGKFNTTNIVIHERTIIFELGLKSWSLDKSQHLIILLLVLTLNVSYYGIQCLWTSVKQHENCVLSFVMFCFILDSEKLKISVVYHFAKVQSSTVTNRLSLTK